MENIKLMLVDPNPGLVSEWTAAFAELPNVEIAHGGFQDLAVFDCIVSPANSFGIMDGGVDAAISYFFGWSLMERVQKRILEEFLGEQPVGTSIIVETGKAKHPYLAHTPTMRVPMPIAHTDHVYTAMWAMLLAVRKHNTRSEKPIGIVACPGLGTGVGQMPFCEAARQMALAYRHFLSPPTAITWQFAARRQDAVGTGGDIGLMMPREHLPLG
jgi:O-acetyl-ADP-ribose deacetylase (regulator of RNase III)